MAAKRNVKPRKKSVDIKLKPKKNGIREFIFPSIPEKVSAKYAVNHMAFDLLNGESIKNPNGMEPHEVSWDGVFFGKTRRNERIVRKEHWMDPNKCVKLLKKYMEEGIEFSLIITGTWINMDVTIASFEAIPFGGHGDVQYSISFTQKKTIKLYTTKDLHIKDTRKKTKPRQSSATEQQVRTYTVVSGDTLCQIARRLCGGEANWTKLYDANADVIEQTARNHGRSGSDHGNWIWPGEVLKLV